MKKLFITVTVLLVLIVIFLVFYNFIFKADKGREGISAVINDKEEVIEDDTPGNIIVADNGEKIVQVGDDAVLSPVLSEDGTSVLYYSANTGKAYSIVMDGSRKGVLSEDELVNLVDVRWSSDKTKVITKFKEGDGYKYFYYNYVERTAKQLPNDADVAIWDNLGAKIVYKSFDPASKKRKILIIDPAKMENPELLTDQIPFQKVQLAQIPQNSVVSFWSMPTAYEESSLREIGISGGETKEIFSRRFGSDYLWSPDGRKCLVSSTDVRGGSRINLGFFNRQGGQYQGLNIPTFVSKSVWSKDGKTVYYALPGSFPAGAVLPDDYDNGSATTADTFWKVDIETGKKERIVDLADIKQNYDASELLLSSTEKYLFFVNRIDGKLYRLEIASVE